MKLTTEKNILKITSIIMFLIAVIFLVPALLTILNSFKPDDEIILNPIKFPGAFSIDNYIEAWKIVKYPTVFFNTFVLTVSSTTGIILISSMAAYILVRSNLKIAWTIYLLFTFAMVVPFQTIMVPLVSVAKNMNLKTSVYGIILIYLGLGCPMAIFMYHGFIKGVPAELEESASIDGSSIFRTFFTIVFPLLKPITATIAILQVLWIWNDFLLPLLIVPKQSTLQLAQYGFFSLFKQEYGKGMASLVLTALPVIIFFLFMQKYIIKGIAAGAVKG